MKILIMVIILSVLLGLVFLVMGIHILIKKGHKFPQFKIRGKKTISHTLFKAEKKNSGKQV
jgi:hypothetical protein